MLFDIRYGLRTLRHNPGFSLVAIVTLGLGIGVNTAIFSVADAFLLKPLPLPEIERLVMLFEQREGQTGSWNNVDKLNYFYWEQQAKSFESLAASEWTDFNLSGQGDPERVAGARVSREFFAALGERPKLGRTFVAEEFASGADRVAVLGYGLWQRRFGADPGIPGRTITIGAKSYTVTGVMPKDFNFPMAADLWTPLPMDPTVPMIRGNYSLQVVGRLKNGIAAEQARAEMQTIARRLADEYPETNKGWGVRVVPLRRFISGELTLRYTVMLMCGVGFVLLIACANVANLQFARAASRQKEMAVRTAIGADRWRIVRQLLVESILLGLGGAALGLLLGEWALQPILSNMPPEIAKFIAGWNQIRLDWRAFLFTLAIAMVAGAISGLAPALGSSKPDLNAALKEGSRGFSAGHTRLRNVLLFGEVALALILLVGAGLMVKGVRTLVEANQNFAPRSLLTMRLALPYAQYHEPRQMTRLYDQALAALAAIPGVEAAMKATTLPYGGGNTFYGFSIAGRPAPAPGELPRAQIQSISPNYFRAMRIALLSGRAFTDRDGADSTRVAIIGESLARRYFPGEDPLGKDILFDGSKRSIVGVAEDVRYGWMARNPAPALYLPSRQAGWSFAYLAVRTDGDPMRLAASVRRQIASLDPNLPVFDIKTLDCVISESLLGLSYVAVMMSVLGAIALVLACVGVYGVMAYTVAERTREIGIRMALGAERADVLRSVLARAAMVTGTGLAIGIVISLILARLLASLIFGVSATDWQTFGSLSFALAAVALAASYIPARRATRVDPMVALRHE